MELNVLYGLRLQSQPSSKPDSNVYKTQVRSKAEQCHHPSPNARSFRTYSRNTTLFLASYQAYQAHP
jgi:hypothetical protein